jgi:hypothetical protein
MANPILKFVERVCVQTAIYWPAPQPDGYGGKTYGDVQEIKVRWDGKQELIKDKEGKEVMSRAEITVIQDLELDGLLKLGSFDDLPSGDPNDIDPMTLDNVYVILQVEKTPLFRSADKFVRRVWV